MQIAIFDHLVQDNNAIGKCHRQLLSDLATEHEFTVFALEFDNPNPERIKFVRVPAIRRPLLLQMITFHILAPLILWLYQWRNKVSFDVVQGIGGNFLLADLAYGHFCHRVYLLEHQDARPKTPVRRIYSFFYDSIVALLEPFIYNRASLIVTPSQGLANELKRHYSKVTDSKIHVLANPVDVQSMFKPVDYEPQPMRDKLGLAADDLVLVFVAAGHFERKGLPLLLDALVEVNNPQVKLLVVGGREYLIEEYQGIVREKGLQEAVQFVGFQKNIRPYLWAADIFAFPSAYEVFPLVSLEAAAAGLPLLASKLNGVEEFLEDGVNGWCVERTSSTYAEKVQEALDNREQVRAMGQQARASVQQYSLAAFSENWKALYADIQAGKIRMKSSKENPYPAAAS